MCTLKCRPTHTRTYKRICRSAVCRRYAREAQHISINARSAKPAAAAAVTPIHGHAHAILRFWAPSAGAVCECACVRVCASVCKCASVRVAINYYRTILLSRLCVCVMRRRRAYELKSSAVRRGAKHNYGCARVDAEMRATPAGRSVGRSVCCYSSVRSLCTRLHSHHTPAANVRRRKSLLSGWRQDGRTDERRRCLALAAVIESRCKV